jgi:hypothetical protein
LRAVDQADLYLERGEIVGLIDKGREDRFNMLQIYKPDKEFSSTKTLRGETHEITKRGPRTFQMAGFLPISAF